MKQIFQSDRKFIVVSYEASHGLLLLRSGKTNEIDTRCDILFYDVRALELRMFSDGIVIAEEKFSYLERFDSAPSTLLEDGLTAYSIYNDNWSGFVLGGIIRIAEDHGDFFDRSTLLPDVMPGS